MIYDPTNMPGTPDKVPGSLIAEDVIEGVSICLYCTDMEDESSKATPGDKRCYLVQFSREPEQTEAAANQDKGRIKLTPKQLATDFKAKIDVRLGQAAAIEYMQFSAEEPAIQAHGRLQMDITVNDSVEGGKNARGLSELRLTAVQDAFLDACDDVRAGLFPVASGQDTWAGRCGSPRGDSPKGKG